MPVPRVFLVFVQFERIGQVLEHAQIVHRVNFTCDRLRQGPDPGATSGIGRKQSWAGMRFIQVFDDRHGLRQAQTIDLQHGHQSVAVDLREILVELLTPRQMD